MSDDYVTRKILTISDNLKAVFDEAKQNDESPQHAADRLVQRVLDRGPA
jgi:hypothetical protein